MLPSQLKTALLLISLCQLRKGNISKKRPGCSFFSDHCQNGPIRYPFHLLFLLVPILLPSPLCLSSLKREILWLVHYVPSVLHTKSCMSLAVFLGPFHLYCRCYVYFSEIKCACAEAGHRPYSMKFFKSSKQLSCCGWKVFYALGYPRSSAS